MREQLRNKVMTARSDAASQYDHLPKKPTNSAQRDLMEKHGSPHSFAQACANALGEISIDEMEDVAARYLKQWEAAA